MKRFKKGDVVYQVRLWNRTVIVRGDRDKHDACHHEYRIYERVVDTCGSKYMTFVESNVYEGLLGRRIESDSPMVQPSISTAIFQALKLIDHAKKGDAELFAYDPKWHALSMSNTYVVNHVVQKAKAPEPHEQNASKN